MSVTKNLIFKYRLVVFLPKDKKSKKSAMDIVPSNWIFFNATDKILQCKFMPDKMYNEKNLKVLTKMIKHCDEPDDQWPCYNIEIRGRANSYEEAEKLAEDLKYDSYAFSTDNEESARSKAKEDEEFFQKFHTISHQKVDQLLKSAAVGLGSDLDENDEISSDTDSAVSTEGKRSKTRKTTRKDEKKRSKGGKSSSDHFERAQELKRHRRELSVANKKKISNSSDDSSSESPVTKYRKLRQQRSKYSGTSSDNEKRPPGKNLIKTSKQITTTPKQFYVTKEMLAEVLKEVMSPFEAQIKSLNTEFNSFKKTVHDVKGMVVETKKVCESNVASSAAVNIDLDGDANDDLKLPCTDIETFEKFDSQLKDDENYRSKMVSKLTSQVNTRQMIVKSTGYMMRFVMGRDVALQFVLKKPNDKKQKAFNATNFYLVLKAILVKKFSTSEENKLPDSEVDGSISSILNHCGDWDGGRSERKKKKKVEEKKTDDHESEEPPKENGTLN